MRWLSKTVDSFCVPHFVRNVGFGETGLVIKTDTTEQCHTNVQHHVHVCVRGKFEKFTHTERAPFEKAD